MWRFTRTHKSKIENQNNFKQMLVKIKTLFVKHVTFSKNTMRVNSELKYIVFFGISMSSHIEYLLYFGVCSAISWITRMCTQRDIIFVWQFFALWSQFNCIHIFWRRRRCLKILLKTVANSNSTLTFHTLNKHILLLKHDFEMS